MFVTLTQVWVSVLLLISVVPLYGFEKVDAFEQDQSQFKVLLYLSKSCPCSRSHVNHLNDLNQRFPKVSFYGVMTDSAETKSRDGLKNYYQSKNFNFPIIFDPGQILVKQYGALKTPHVVILKKHSKSYRLIYQGGVSDSRVYQDSSKKFLAENLQALNDGQPIKYTQGKSLGCYIRRL